MPPTGARINSGADASWTGCRKALVRWFRRHARDLPWRTTRDPYAVLVSEFMLQQTTVAAVVPRYTRWLRRFPDFKSLARAGETAVLREWEGLGYYARARNLHALARHIVQWHDGRLPDSEAGLRELPGMGPYTVGAVLSFAYDRPVPALDANISRVLARLHAIEEPIDTVGGRRALEAAAVSLLPQRRGGAMANGALMELGALICRPRNPQCPVCPARHWCRATVPDMLPRKKPRRRIVDDVDERLWRTDGLGRVAVCRSNGPRWKGLYVLPEKRGPDAGPLVYAASYAITHHRVALRVYAVDAPAIEDRDPAVAADRVEEHPAPGGGDMEWVAPLQLGRLPFAAPFRRAIKNLQEPPAQKRRAKHATSLQRPLPQRSACVHGSLTGFHPPNGR